MRLGFSSWAVIAAWTLLLSFVSILSITVCVPPEKGSPLRDSTTPRREAEHPTKPAMVAEADGKEENSYSYSSGLLSARIINRKRSKPPMVYNYLEINLQNPANEARWIVIPAYIPRDGKSRFVPEMDNMTSGLLILSTTSPTHFTIAYTYVASIYAIQLPARARLALKGLRVLSFWISAPKVFTLEMIVARKILIGSMPIEKCFAVSPLIASGLTIQLPESLGLSKSYEWAPPGQKELPLKIDVESRHQITIPLPPAR